MAAKVVVAADDGAIAHAVEPLDVETVLTSPSHQSGTARVADVAARPRFAAYDTVLNVQADEPFVTAAALLGAVERVRIGDAIGTAGAPLTPVALANRARVKVAVDGKGHAVRFTRVLPASIAWGCDVAVLQHIGIYAFTKAALARWLSLPEVSEEQGERLEQMRPLVHGLSIGVAATAALPGPAVDTFDDLERAEAYMAAPSPKAMR